MNLSKKAFALPELLLALGLVALLAAIAFPAYRQSLVRSKISHVHSDFRKIAVALESYRADHAAYPFDLDSRGWPWYLTDVLTTPVPYLTTNAFLQDPFRSNTGTTFLIRRYRYINYPANGPDGYWPPCPLPGPFTDRWIGNTPPVSVSENARAALGDWKLLSAGPDETYEQTSSFFGESTQYDPTNGVLSGGDLFRSQARKLPIGK